SPTPPGRRPSTPGCSTHGGTGNARRSGTALAGTPVAERLRCRRCGAARSHRLHHPAHDPRVLADLPDAAEPVLLEQLDGPAPEEPPVCLAPGGHLGYGLDETAAGACDLVQRALQRGSGHALATVPPVDEDARDPPVRTRRRVLVVLAPVLDVRKLLGAAVLRPSLRGAVRVEDEGGGGAIGPHAFLLEGATVEPPLLALRVETEAPAATEDPVVALYQVREGIPRRGVERSDRVRHGRVPLDRGRAPASAIPPETHPARRELAATGPPHRSPRGYLMRP